MSVTDETLKAELAAWEAEVSAYKKELDRLKGEERRRDAQSYYGKLRDEGKLTPALFETAVALDTRLEEAERISLRDLVGAFETKVDLSGVHKADKKSATPAGADITEKIKAFQKEKGIASFADAAEALYAAHPALFEEGVEA